jgi:predicted transcriptional regulator
VKRTRLPAGRESRLSHIINRDKKHRLVILTEAVFQLLARERVKYECQNQNDKFQKNLKNITNYRMQKTVAAKAAY